MKAEFLSDLIVKLVKDETEELWEYVEPFTYRSAVVLCQLTIPVGFRTNFCSVPRLPFIYAVLGNRAKKAGGLHDYLYFSRMFPRYQCDLILREAVLLSKFTEDEAKQVYLAVRMFGESHYGHE